MNNMYIYGKPKEGFMSRNHFNELSPCEALIMKLIWEAPQDIPVQELIDQLRDDYGKDYARTTVVTFVGKLKDKRFVDTYRKGKAAFIHPLRSEEEYRRQLKNSDAKNYDFWTKHYREIIYDYGKIPQSFIQLDDMWYADRNTFYFAK